MPRDQRIVVVDETGTGNRPQDKGDQNFGVGALIFPRALQVELAQAGRRIGQSLKKGDYKYKHVQASTVARTQFLEIMNGFKGQIMAYAFFTADQSIADETRREQAAAESYGSRRSRGDDDKEDLATAALLESFIKYMAPQIGAHALTNGYEVEVHWDRRTDLTLIEDTWREQLALIAKLPRYKGIDRVVSFAGAAGGDLSHVTRLAGVVAGDIRQYFLRHGERIWAHLDETGLHEDTDPIIQSVYRWKPPPAVATLSEMLADPHPDEGSRDSTMLQGYYKRFQQSDETGHYLISFGAPGGRLGILCIEHGSRWHIHQLPD